MREAQYDEEAGVDDDLTEVVGTANQVKQTSLRDGVTAGILPLQLSKDLVSLELLVPGSQEDEGGKPCRQRDGGN